MSFYIEVLASPTYSAEQTKRGLAAITDELAKIGIKRDNLVLMVTQANAWFVPIEAAHL
jgi:hypothetical protein